MTAPAPATQHELAAQRAAEEAYVELVEQDESECTCQTCVVRVVLEAAWPNLLEAARIEARTSVLVPATFDGDPSTCDSGADVLALKAFQ